jgi:hypothetical protein
MVRPRRNDWAIALIDFESLTAYEQYRARLAADPGAQANAAFVREARAILAERRSFLRKVKPERIRQARRARRGDDHAAAVCPLKAAGDPAELE